jgi:hypothetical protein
VIPDLRVTKMDNFKSLSVGAGDWIEIEECKEEVRREAHWQRAVLAPPCNICSLSTRAG